LPTVCFTALVMTEDPKHFWDTSEFYAVFFGWTFWKHRQIMKIRDNLEVFIGSIEGYTDWLH
jgi:hypothetical protein